MNKTSNQSKSINSISKLIHKMQYMPAAQVSELLENMEEELVFKILENFPAEKQGSIFAEFSRLKQLKLFQSISRLRFAPLFENMPSDKRVDFFQYLTQEEQATLLPFLCKKVKEDVIALSAYPPEVAGGIMSTDFATVQNNMTCAQALEKIKSEAPYPKNIYHVYVVNKDQHLLGFISLKDLILAAPDTNIERITNKEFIAVYVDEDREKVAKLIEKYNLITLPVINHQNQLVGIVTQEDAIDIINAEHSEDLQKFMGIIQASEEFNYLGTYVLKHFQKRVVWIISLAIVGIISGLIIHNYEKTLDKLLILALYMPMVADTGGNAGSQAATVVVRALALGQINLKDWVQVLWKETKISVLLAVCLGILAYGKVVFLSWETEIPPSFSLVSIALMIAIALSLQVISATIIGAALPLLVKAFGGDPAVAASPAITTIVDITGLLIYFGMATLFFGL
ncbi:MAG: magnesium transporter [Bacteroidia bacterium]|nr:magnesium transporter [Bacteroidia bacterium]MDW8157390.1 magnesium transporter [Bacteroidia bacterium]